MSGAPAALKQAQADQPLGFWPMVRFQYPRGRSEDESRERLRLRER